MNSEKLFQLDREHVVYSWKNQKDAAPIMMEKADRIYMWDVDGKRYTDFSSGLLNVNIGHNNEHIKKAMREQMEKVCYVGTGFGTEVKAVLSKMISEVTPGDLDYVFYTNGGAEAVENAIKAARAYTGRHKIYSRWRSYHGATAGAITLTGDPRRWAAEPGIPGVVKYFGPYGYNCPFGTENAEESGQKALEMLKTQVMLDGPHTVAAIFMEPIVGTNGIIIPTESYVKGVRELCDEYGILLIADETMSGWGRSGKWFCMEHFGVVPDIMTTAKGVTSGYVPLGCMIWSKKIWEYFWDHPFMGGLTYGGHALACATGIANIEVYKEDKLIENSENLGNYLEKKLLDLKEKHPSIGDVRCKGLWACVELTADRKTKAPLAGFNNSIRNVAGPLMKILYDEGLYTFCKWDFVFLSPPLCITREEIDESLEKLEVGLRYTDSLL
ncbi:MAG: aminotransferase class III-fold pyridoxal phosphate-dependent enzyme [Sphaerochaetaceae bacterium]